MFVRETGIMGKVSVLVLSSRLRLVEVDDEDRELSVGDSLSLRVLAWFLKISWKIERLRSLAMLDVVVS